jgi:L-seryl-tRNA(Ser) seleniumtransferase
MAELRSIPSIEHLRQRPAVRLLEARFGPEATVDALRAGAAALRHAMREGGGSPSTDEAAREIESIAAARLDEAFRVSLQPVINATGVILHTNLGRAPLADAAIARVSEVVRSYSTLEYDPARGQRGRRDVHAEAMLCGLTGAEAATVVNNNAAATMLILAAMAAGREVVVSRGELVEIGGGFRVPDVLTQSGAILREVGTTNKTRAADYAAAISDKTALLLRVHPSNFQIQGFTARPGLAELIAVGKKFNIPVAEDLGSGYLLRSHSGPTPVTTGVDSGRDRSGTGVGPEWAEPAVEASVAAGVDLCCFSGDKLLGGPQAGIIVGRATLVDRVRSHPLMRALRVDKMTYAALEATLAEYAAGRASTTVPVQRMLTLTADDILARAAALQSALSNVDGLRTEIIAGESAVGGGSAPGVGLPTSLVAIAKRELSPTALAERLRRASPPVIARIENDRVLLDLRTVFERQDAELAAVLKSL